MKLALVHDWLTNMAGSERVVEAMHGLWPEAPVYTSLYVPEALSPALQGMDVRVSWLSRVPGLAQRWRLALPLMPHAFESFDLSDYDVVLTSAHACAKGVITPAETCHICYCYTPIRYAWVMPHEYLGEMRGLKRAATQRMLSGLRVWDYAAAQRVDRFIGISHTVRRRIAKFYRRDAAVLYPPVETSRFAPAAQREDFYLMVSRLVGYKRVDLAAAAFSELGRSLKIVGTGPDEARVRAAAGPGVELLGWRSDEEVRDLFARARGFVFPGVEDFGLTVVEAQAAGCPVIAYGEGGATETVVDGETGLFFREPTTAALVEAVREFERREWSPDACVANARRFDTSRFGAELRGFVEAAAAEHGARLDGRP